MISTRECAADMVHRAAGMSNPALLALLVQHGADVNIPADPNWRDRPIGAAARAGHKETVRWLVEHGSEINYDPEDHEFYCEPLAHFVLQGDMEMVKLLVEHRARLNVLDRRLTTPLSIAIRCKHKEIIDYLRSKGAIEDYQLPGFLPHEQRNPILDCVRNNFGQPEIESWLPIVPDDT